MSMVTIHFQQFLRDLDRANQERVSAGTSAVKKVGYDLWKSMRREIRAGAPGGGSLTPLREISQRGRRHKPLSALQHAVRYRKSGSGLGFHMEIGAGIDTRAERRASMEPSFFSSAGREWADKGLSASWASIFIRQQSGFTTPVTPAFRKYLFNIGDNLRGKRGRLLGRARYFFLSKGTTTFKIPPRDIVDTFWRAHRPGVPSALSSHFEAKLRGKEGFRG